LGKIKEQPTDLNFEGKMKTLLTPHICDDRLT